MVEQVLFDVIFSWPIHPFDDGYDKSFRTNRNRILFHPNSRSSYNILQKTQTKTFDSQSAAIIDPLAIA